MKTCLSVPDCWGAAANALEYAGLTMKDFVMDRNIGITEESSLPVADVERANLDVEKLALEGKEKDLEFLKEGIYIYICIYINIDMDM
jgi:hypothetical protein